MSLRSALTVAVVLLATVVSLSSALEPPPYTKLARLQRDILSNGGEPTLQTLSQTAADASFIEIALRKTDKSATEAPHTKTHPLKHRVAFVKGGKHGSKPAVHHGHRFATDTTTTTTSSSSTTATTGGKTVKEEEPKPPKVIWVGGTKRVGPWPFTADGAIPWMPLIFVTLGLLVTIVLCCIAFKLEWITLDKIAKSIDACCYFFVLICWGIKWIVTYVPRYTWYPCKECCHSCVVCWNSYFYPYKNTT